MKKPTRDRLTEKLKGRDHYQREREDQESEGTYYGVGRRPKIGSERESSERIIPVDSYCRRPFGSHDIEDEE